MHGLHICLSVCIGVCISASACASACASVCASATRSFGYLCSATCHVRFTKLTKLILVASPLPPPRTVPATPLPVRWSAVSALPLWLLPLPPGTLQEAKVAADFCF